MSCEYELGFSELIDLNADLIKAGNPIHPTPLSAVFIGRDIDSGLKKVVRASCPEVDVAQAQTQEYGEAILEWQAAFRAFYPLEMRGPKKLASTPDIRVTEDRQPATETEKAQALCSDVLSSGRMPDPQETAQLYSHALNAAQRLETLGYAAFAKATYAYLETKGVEQASRPTATKDGPRPNCKCDQ